MSNSKVIVRNTIFLYIRMFITMGVSLFTSRIVLNTLGIGDYGIYTLVGGFVAMFGFFNSAMSVATQRYMAFDIGRNDSLKLKKTFSITLSIHIAIAIIVLFFAETIGLWYVNNVMVYPKQRLFAVNVIYQISVVTTILGITQVPYNALIVVKEKMKIYAFISIIEALLKLIFVFLLTKFGCDKLIFYAIFTIIIAVFIRLLYYIYCISKFEESRYTFEFEKNKVRELLSFTGWNSLGSIALLLTSQLNNLTVNFFFGTHENAAFGIAMLVQNAVLLFAQNFQTAVNPQIIKLYSQNNLIEMKNLLFYVSKYSFYLILLLIVPIIFNIEEILKLWLVVVPLNTATMIKLILINILIEILSFSIIVGIQSTGNVKHFQITLSTIVFLNIPITYVLFRCGAEPYILFFVLIFISVISLIFRLYFLEKLLGINSYDFFNKVIFRAIYISILLFLVPFLYNNFIKYKINIHNIYFLLLNLIFIEMYCVIIIYLFGFNKLERDKLLNIFRNRLKNEY